MATVPDLSPLTRRELFQAKSSTASLWGPCSLIACDLVYKSLLPVDKSRLTWCLMFGRSFISTKYRVLHHTKRLCIRYYHQPLLLWCFLFWAQKPWDHTSAWIVVLLTRVPWCGHSVLHSYPKGIERYPCPQRWFFRRWDVLRLSPIQYAQIS